MVRILTLIIPLWLTFLWIPAFAGAAEIPMDLARQVAENTIFYHISIYGHWADTDAVRAEDGVAIRYQDTLIAYNFEVSPSGHVLVAAHDEFSPVLLYSTTSEFKTDRATTPGALESWIINECYQSMQAVNSASQFGGTGPRSLQTNLVKDRIERSWDLFGSDAAFLGTEYVGRAAVKSNESTQTVGPLLTTSWSQSYPYNNLTPSDSGCAHTLTGCVATAFSQLLNYWNWPPKGVGSHSYSWRPAQGPEETLSANFAHTYNWDLMPDQLDGGSTDAQIESVARLMADMGVAVETIYGCGSSGSYVYADDVLDLYFRYKAVMVQHVRSNYTADQWFNLIKEELDANPPRPVVLSVFLADYSGGHETIVDGYQAGITDKVHINFGWSGAYNGYYDITHNFTTGFYTWDGTFQVAVTGIEPLNTPPTADAGADRTAVEGEVITLVGSGIDPDGAAIASYRWVQIQGPAVTLSGATSQTPSFTVPQLSAETPLIFKLSVTDNLGATTEDTCIITLSDADSSGDDGIQGTSDGSGGVGAQDGAGSASGSSGGGGGGSCFIGTLLP